MADSIGPHGTSDIGGGTDVDFFAFAVDYLISFITFFANSFLLVKLKAFTLNFTAHSVFIEIISWRAFDTRVVVPDSASEVIIELDKEGRVV